jgi:hypothetical protein
MLRHILFVNLNICSITTLNHLHRTLAHLSDVAKQKGIKFSRYWRYCINLELFVGYAEDTVMKETQFKVIKDWLYDEYTHEYDQNKHTGGTLFHDDFRLALRKLFDKEHTTPDNMRSISDFITDKKWNRGKASDTRPLSVLYKGKITKTRKTKSSTSFELSNEEVYNMLTTFSPQNLVIRIKPDGGKSRNIAVGDMPNYLKMDFLSDLIENGFKGTTWSPLFMGQKKQSEMWSNMIKESQDDTLVKIPIDQSKFDHQPSRKMIRIVFEEIQRVCHEKGTAEQAQVSDVLINGMLSDKSVVKIDDIMIQYRKGVASGWRWTALIDTLINKAEFDVVIAEVERRIGRPIKIISSQFQGDDVRCSLREPKWVASLILSIYKELGFEVNPDKTLIVTDRDEFLRYTIDNNVLIGYPARLTLGLTSRKPNSDAPLTKYDRIHNMIINHIRAICRGWDMPRVVDCLLRNMRVWFMDDSMDTIISFILTPSSLGGFGLSSYDNMYHYLISKLEGPMVYTSFIPTVIDIINKPNKGSWVGQLPFYSSILGYKLRENMIGSAIMQVLPSASQERIILSKAHLSSVSHLNMLTNRYLEHRCDIISSIGAVINDLPVPNLYKMAAIKDICDSESFLESESILTVTSFSDVLTLLRKQVSKNVIKSYLLGTIKCPIPKQTSRDPTLMNNIVNKHEYVIRTYMSRRHATMRDVEAGCFLAEMRISKDFNIQKNNMIPFFG